jgi:hypothetical protein
MENINVVSTPNIEGNIGSCKTEVVTTITGRNSIWTLNQRDVTTNSCTGEVNNYDYWSISREGSGILFFSGLFVTIIICVVIYNLIINS